MLRSSAGAGKTHELTFRWLSHALGDGDPQAFRRVLALTFTNKAAGEMKERVMEMLHGLASNERIDGRVIDIRTRLLQKLEISDETLRQRANATLEHMLHQWSDVAITTLDSFTRRVVKPFARDLRMDGDLEMTTEQEDFRARAVDRLLAEVGHNAGLTDLLMRACLRLVDDERSWRPDVQLRALGRELDKESSIGPVATLRGIDLDQLLKVEDELRARVRAFRDRMREHGRRALRIIQEEDVTEADLAYGNRGVISYFRKLERFDGLLAPMGGNTTKVLETDRWSSSKADAGAMQRIDHIAPLLREIIVQVERSRDDGALRRHAVERAVLSELLPSAALHLIDVQLERLKREEGVAFFSDLTRKAAGDLQREPPAFIWERIGEKYRHMLLDEFQDTSLLQWISLLPLVENVLGNGGTVELVGDAKQAIYRWRNGEARLLKDLPRLHARDRIFDGDAREHVLREHYEAPAPLVHNRRSGSAIIAFNNLLFERLKQHLSEDLAPVYDAHQQEPHKQEVGYARLEVISKDAPDAADEDGTEGPTVAPEVLRAAEIVRECEASGFRRNDIAVLVRNKKQAQQIAIGFAAKGIDVLSTDGMLLGNDPAVALLIDLLRWFYLRDLPAGTRVVQGMVALGLTADVKALLDPIGALDAWTAEHPTVNLRLAPDELLNACMDALDLPAAGDIHRMVLLDEVHAFVARGGGGIGDFLEHWERKGVERAVQLPAANDTVQVLTIHKAKGLQFPVVIVPFTDMAGRQRDADGIWIAPGDLVPELPAALVRFSSLRDMQVPEIDEEERLRRLDDLDLLYVAFTRPEQRLYALVPDIKKIDAEKKQKDPFGVELLEFVRDHGSEVYETGEATSPWKGKSTDGAGSDQWMALSAGVPTQPHRAVVAIRREAPEEWSAHDPDPFRSFGRQVHAILERVAVPGDLERALGQAVAHREVGREMGIALHAKLSALLALPEVAPFFRPGLHVRSEATLIDQYGQAHRPDRIVMDGERTRVLDIKTGHRSEHHHEQVRTYVRLLREVDGGEVSGHLLYLGDGAVVEVNA